MQYRLSSNLRNRCQIIVIGLLVWTLAACSSSDSPNETAPGEDVDSSTPSGNDAEPGTDIENEDADNTPVNPVTETPETDTPVELSPIELMLGEITLAANSVLHQLNRKIQSGQTLSEIESDCLGDYNPATGLSATSINCPSAGLAVYNSIATTKRVDLADSEDCQAVLAQDSLLAAPDPTCPLNAASIDIPIEWVQNPNSPPSQIGSVSPIAGVAINYNGAMDGILNLQSNSDVTVPFDCNIDINSATLLDNEEPGCRAEIDAVTRRLFSFRQNQVDN